MNIVIAVCDDDIKEHDNINVFCDKYLSQYGMQYELLKFSTGEELLKYCSEESNSRIDVVFLDIELTGISGLELKDILLKSDKIWRVAYFSSHTEIFFETYSIKTIGFVRKPALAEDVEKILKIVVDEKKDNIIISLNDANGQLVEIELEDIIYLKADRSYTEVYTYSKQDEACKYVLCTKKMGAIENELEEYNIIRVHKSYMANLLNVKNVTDYITFTGTGIKIPVGRKYRDTVKIKSFNYGKNKVKKRL